MVFYEKNQWNFLKKWIQPKSYDLFNFHQNDFINNGFHQTKEKKSKKSFHIFLWLFWNWWEKNSRCTFVENCAKNWIFRYEIFKRKYCLFAVNERLSTTRTHLNQIHIHMHKPSCKHRHPYKQTARLRWCGDFILCCVVLCWIGSWCGKIMRWRTF